jgi:hypothetical protein
LGRDEREWVGFDSKGFVFVAQTWNELKVDV